MIESLEKRSLMSVTLSDGVLTAISGGEDNVVTVSTEADKVLLNINGKKRRYDADDVTSLVIRTTSGDDRVINNTAIPSTIDGGNGDDFIRGGTSGDTLIGGNGNDIISDFVPGVGVNTLDGGNGDDNLWGGFGAGDFLYGGNGNDVIYDIVGGVNTVDSGRGADITVNRITDNVPSDFSDTAVEFGATSGPIGFANGILYVFGGAGDDKITVTEQGTDLFVKNVTADGTFTRTIARSRVKMIGGVGGAGNDTYINNSSVKSVFYGTGGNDTLIGGSSKDILKGGDGDDILVGQWGNDDLTGDGGSDYISGGVGDDILRTDGNDILDRDTDDVVVV